jgi:type I restriction enzyme S subunit
VIDEIDASHVSQIPFPMLKDKSAQTEINRLALDANSMRSDAYELEQRAIKTMNDEVLCV